MKLPRPGPLAALLPVLSPSRFQRWPRPTDAVMQGVVYTEHGPPEVLQHRADLPTPAPAPGQLRVEIRAVGLNPVDFKMRRNRVPSVVFPKPKIPGTDLCGVVRESRHPEFAVGQRVFGMMPLLGAPWGACAAEACVHGRYVAPVPDELDDIGAASLPLVALTVLQGLAPALRAWGGRGEGKRALVQAASGGLGTFAVQVLTSLGVQVTGTCSAANADLVRELGATEVIDYRRERFEEHVQGVDLVFDPVAWQYRARTLASDVLAEGGWYVHIASSDWSARDAGPGGLSIPEAMPHRVALAFAQQWLGNAATRVGLGKVYEHYVFVHPDGARMHEVAELVRDGQIRPVIDRTFPFSEAEAAHRYLETGRARGKVVLVPG